MSKCHIDLLKWLALPLPEFRPVIIDLAGGAGRPLGNATTQHHLVAPADMAGLAPLLAQARFAADLVFATSSAAQASATLEQALALLSPYGEGLLLVAGQPTLTPELQAHVWACLTVTGQTALYFAHAPQAGRFSQAAAGLEQVRQTGEWLARQRLKYRRGAEAQSYACTTDSVIAWDAAHGEYQSRRSGTPRYNLVLKATGHCATHFSAFDKRANRAGDAGLAAVNGRELKSVVVNRALRHLLADLIAAQDPQYPTIHPAVITAYRQVIAAAIAQAQALRAGIPETPLPTGLVATLRPYQKEGFDFLAHLSRIGKGGILADDMGLGKTLQTLTWLLSLQQHRPADGPALVLCPASVMHNWRREAEKFTPQLKVKVLESGPKRAAALAQLNEFDLVITNYALLRRDFSRLAATRFRALILDEAQFIKNPDAQLTKLVKQLPAQHRLALTGTPLENRLLDLWSIVDFASPGHLGPRQEFKAAYEDDTATGRKLLARQLRPLLLRRLKKDVAQDLPDRIELRHDCTLPPAQRALYQRELQRSRALVLKAVEEQGLPQSRIHVLAALTRLRQICCHPALIDGGQAVSTSGKTDTFFELIDALVTTGKQVLVFSQFTRMLDLLQAECRRRQIATHLLTGETTNRQAVVDEFNHHVSKSGQGSVFLLSLRAAGTGLNLTKASEVILYDPWWNPAVEAQAIDRAHRIGQTCKVNAYRLIARDTIEERIWNIQQQKASTIQAVLGEGGFTRQLTRTDLEYLFGGVEAEGGDAPAAPPAPNELPAGLPLETLSPESEPMKPRHQPRSAVRNTRAPHIPPPATAPPPLWRQRLAAKRPSAAVPTWRAEYGT